MYVYLPSRTGGLPLFAARTVWLKINFTCARYWQNAFLPYLSTASYSLYNQSNGKTPFDSPRRPDLLLSLFHAAGLSVKQLWLT